MKAKPGLSSATIKSPSPLMTHPYCNRRNAVRLSVAVGAAWAALAMPAQAAFISSDRTIANGNPLNGNYIGDTQWVGVSSVANGEVQRVANVRVDVVEPALFSYSDQTGGGIDAYSNSALRVYGGTFNQISPTGAGGGISLNDTSTGVISGGTLRFLGVNGLAAGAAGAHATVSGGLIQNGLSSVAYVLNGTLQVTGGSIISQSGQAAIAGADGSVISVSGGTVQSLSGAAIYLGANSALTLSGGTVSGAAGGGAQWGVRLEDATITAALNGGTVNGGVRANSYAPAPATQAALGGTLTVNGGVFANGSAALDVSGGSYSRFAGADASFFALGSNSINFYGTDLSLSGPTAGSVFETNHFNGNFYTFTGGTFADGQSAIGLRIFDAETWAGGAAALVGGFTLNPSPVPEPASGLLLLLALPLLAVELRRKSQAQA
ncbi:PEP-CTERM sorting domain-containing protein [Roseateles sp.]|uniref:PEP-CTERM sorting domain-containing protein n=1 Tax=Roseateles sp. TaxID=1971397 RepID=UPI00286A6572|nr:PEP-CTERM sorting domain-containing protein [Roseateles sp.]